MPVVIMPLALEPPRMNRDKLFKHWHRRYRRLLKRQDLLLRQSRNQGRPEHIHDLRVTLRRLRLMVRVSGPLVDPAAAEPYRRWSRKISNATSHLRDFDVTLEWLATQRLDTAVAESLAARRQRLWKMGRRRLLPLPPEIRSVVRKLESGKRGRQRLWRRYHSRFARLHARVVAQIPGFFDFDEAERHAFRRTVRLLRYLREFALKDRKRHHDRLIEALARPQEAMGECQNIVLARRIIGTLKSPAPPPALTRALVREQARRQRAVKSSLDALATEW
jgi:CHAD domain-containing protein